MKEELKVVRDNEGDRDDLSEKMIATL
jgi:hypothetical protein